MSALLCASAAVVNSGRGNEVIVGRAAGVGSVSRDVELATTCLLSTPLVADTSFILVRV